MTSPKKIFGMSKKKAPTNGNGRLETILDNGSDFGARHIYFIGEINEGSARKFLITLLQLDRASHEEILVYLNSPGGSSYDGMAMFDAVRAAQSPVVMIGMGHVMSAAAMLLQAADQRMLTPETRFMVHDGSWYLGDAHARVLIAAGKEMDAMAARSHEIFAKRAKMDVEKVRKLFNDETFMTAQQALDYGFADALYTGAGK